MQTRIRPSLLALALGLGAAAIPAQSCLTTVLTGTTSTSNGCAALFDMTLASNLLIQSIDCNMTAAASTPLTLDVWVTPNTWIGNHTNQAAWTLVGSATANSGGAAMTTFTFAAPFLLSAGSYGVSLVPSNNTSHRYSSGVSTQTFSDNFMSLTLGAIQAVPWVSATPLNPRHWNGTICYQPAAGLFANFTSNVRSGPVPTTVNFSDTSYSSDPGGVLAWAWDLDGDSVIDSTLQHPSFTYTACGAYTVSLTVVDASHPTSTATRTGYIEIGITPIAPTFTYAPIAPGVFQFTDTSTPTPASWAWDLDGDSVTDSTAQNPVWFYPNPCAAVPVTLSVSSTCAGPWSATQNLLLSPTSLTSVSIPNNGLSANNAGALFDVDVTNPNGVTICALSLYPFTAGATATCNVYVTDAPGGVATSYNQAALWRLVATGTGASTGTTTTPSVFSLSNPVYLPQGQYAMAIGTSLGLRYTTITGPVTTTGPDFSITTGRSAGPLFSAGIANRGFAGTFHYSVVGNGDLAGYGFFGSGCPGTLGISNLENDSEPSLGNTMIVTANNLPQNAAIMLVGFSKTVSGLGALPLSLGAFGAPGCNLRVSPDANVLMLGTGNQATWTFPVPNNAAFVGLNLYNQAVVFDPAANAAGAVGSDAHAMLLGN